MSVAPVRWLFCVVLLALAQIPLCAQIFIVNQNTSTNAHGSSQIITLDWSASPDTNTTGYFVCWGLESGEETNQLDVGQVTFASLGGLGTNGTYYFYIIAYGSGGAESEPSNEIDYSVPGANSGGLSNSPVLAKLTTLISFDFTNGSGPLGGLTLATDGNFYGATCEGGTNGLGTIFKMTPSGVLTTLVSFNPALGYNPLASPLQGSDGGLYGTTSMGGTNEAGMVFRVTTNGVLTTVASFGFASGYWPTASLTEGPEGGFYGTTSKGGLNSSGTAFQVATNGTLTTLASFGNTNGFNPGAGLLVGMDTNLYGTTISGGTKGYGTVFKLTTSGAFTTLHSFTGGGDGANPYAALAQGANGSYFGTACSGGANGFGTIFNLATNGTCATPVAFSNNNGASPLAGLLEGSDGNFYGTTECGGAHTNISSVGYGTVFQLTTNGTLTTLVSFDGTNGASPYAGLVQTADGSFYGTTAYGGAFDQGTIFRLALVMLPTLQAMAQPGGSLSLTWNATSGDIYQVQFNTNLGQTNWNSLGGTIIATNSAMTVFDSIGPDAQRFYRVVMMP